MFQFYLQVKRDNQKHLGKHRHNKSKLIYRVPCCCFYLGSNIQPLLTNAIIEIMSKEVNLPFDNLFLANQKQNQIKWSETFDERNKINCKVLAQNQKHWLLNNIDVSRLKSNSKAAWFKPKLNLWTEDKTSSPPFDAKVEENQDLVLNQMAKQDTKVNKYVWRH